MRVIKAVSNCSNAASNWLAFLPATVLLAHSKKSFNFVMYSSTSSPFDICIWIRCEEDWVWAFQASNTFQMRALTAANTTTAKTTNKYFIFEITFWYFLNSQNERWSETDVFGEYFDCFYTKKFRCEIMQALSSPVSMRVSLCRFPWTVWTHAPIHFFSSYLIYNLIRHSWVMQKYFHIYKY